MSDTIQDLLRMRVAVARSHLELSHARYYGTRVSWRWLCQEVACPLGSLEQPLDVGPQRLIPGAAPFEECGPVFRSQIEGFVEEPFDISPAPR